MIDWLKWFILSVAYFTVWVWSGHDSNCGVGEEELGTTEDGEVEAMHRISRSIHQAVGQAGETGCWVEEENQHGTLISLVRYVDLLLWGTVQLASLASFHSTFGFHLCVARWLLTVKLKNTL